MGRDDFWGYKPYVPVAQRRAQAAREVAKRMKAGQKVLPIKIDGRTIAATFWGKAWCTNLESYSDFENRLPRGRTYVRNGSVVHLTIASGRIEALVSGSDLYKIQIDIAALSKEDWRTLKAQCAGKIGTLVELLKGKLSQAVMELVTARENGLFPKPKEIKMRCSCPDGAWMCKHIAAAMYGVGNRLDASPELLFVLRGVDHLELIEQAIPTAPLGTINAPTIDSADFGDIFGIEMSDAPTPPAPEKSPSQSVAAKKTAARKKDSPAKKSPTPTKAVVAPNKAAAPVKKTVVAPKKAAPPKKAVVPPPKAVASQKTSVVKKAATVAKKQAARPPAPKSATAEKAPIASKKTPKKR